MYLSSKQVTESDIPICSVKGSNKFKNVFICGKDEEYDSDSELYGGEAGLFDILPEDMIRKLSTKKIGPKQMRELEMYLLEDQIPKDLFIRQLGDKLKLKLHDGRKKEFIVQSGELTPCVNPNLQRDVILCAGPSGSGKSTLASLYMANYRKMFPKRAIYIFSMIKEDEVLDRLKPKRIRIDENLIEEPMDIEELKDSCVLFDDLEGMHNKKLEDAVRSIMHRVLEEGRHFNICCICTTHVLLNSNKTKILLNEASQVYFFPKSGSGYQIQNFLKRYIGLNKEQISKIMRLPSRYVGIKKDFPLAVIYNKGAYLLD